MEQQIINQLSQFGIIGIIFYFFIKEFFGWLNKKKNNGNSKDIVEQLRLLNENHLTDITATITCGNKEIVGAINAMHLDVVKELGEIKSRLNR